MIYCLLSTLGPSNDNALPHHVLLVFGLVVTGLAGGSRLYAAHLGHMTHPSSDEALVQLTFCCVWPAGTIILILLLFTRAVYPWTGFRRLVCFHGTITIVACVYLRLLTDGRATGYPPSGGSFEGALVNGIALILFALWLTPANRIYLHSWLCTIILDPTAAIVQPSELERLLEEGQSTSRAFSTVDVERPLSRHLLGTIFAFAAATAAVVLQSFLQTSSSSPASHSLRQLAPLVPVACIVFGVVRHEMVERPPCQALHILVPGHSAALPDNKWVAVCLMAVLGAGSRVYTAHIQQTTHATPETFVQLADSFARAVATTALALTFTLFFSATAVLDTESFESWIRALRGLMCVHGTISIVACVSLFVWTDGTATAYPPARGALMSSLIGSLAHVLFGLWFTPSHRVKLAACSVLIPVGRRCSQRHALLAP